MEQANGMGLIPEYGYTPGSGFQPPVPVAVVQTPPNYLLWAVVALIGWWAYQNWGSISKKLEAFKTLTGGSES